MPKLKHLRVMISASCTTFLHPGNHRNNCRLVQVEAEGLPLLRTFRPNFRSPAALTRHTLRPGDTRQGFLAIYSWSLTQSLIRCASVRLQPGLRGVADGS
ncbi:hypothetical protein IG631_03236 [Alternaria alternata]|nr:hypothetical protein IG631_03236 [Alternaria alternata]